LGPEEAALRHGVDRGDARATAELAYLLDQRGQLVEAEALYRRAVVGGDVDAMILLGILLEKRGEWAEAELVFWRALAEGRVEVASGYLEGILPRLGSSDMFERYVEVVEDHPEWIRGDEYGRFRPA